MLTITPNVLDWRIECVFEIGK